MPPASQQTVRSQAWAQVQLLPAGAMHNNAGEKTDRVGARSPSTELGFAEFGWKDSAELNLSPSGLSPGVWHTPGVTLNVHRSTCGGRGGTIPKQPWEETHGPENTDIHVSPSLGHGSTSQQPHAWLALGSGTGQQVFLECASVSSPPWLLPCPPHLLCSLLFKHVVSRKSVIPLSFKKSKTVTRVRYVF